MIVHSTKRVRTITCQHLGPFVLSLSKHERAAKPRRPPFDKLRANGGELGEMAELSHFMKLLMLMTTLLCAVAAGEPAPEADSYRAGVAAYDHGDPAAALAHFEKAALTAEKPQVIHYDMGLCHLDLKETTQAREAFEKAAAGEDPLISLKARYNIAHAHYSEALKPTSDAGVMRLELAPAAAALDAFRDAARLAEKEPLAGLRAARRIAEDARSNARTIVALLKTQHDEEAQREGGRVQSLQGTVKVNGRPISGAFVYVKSKWEDEIQARARSREAGTYIFDKLEVGKYQLAARLYEVNGARDLDWGKEVRVPATAQHREDLEIQGPFSLGCPYLATSPSLQAPFDDHLRGGGPESLTRSTDWGELTDGRPSASFPENSDTDMGYVAFSTPSFQIVMALPPPPPPSEEIKNSTEPKTTPTYIVTLKGYGGGDAVPPKGFAVLGLKQGKDSVPLYNTVVETTNKGRYEWSSPPFDQQGFNHLIFAFARQGGERVSLHEIEVQERRDGKPPPPPPQEDKDKNKQEQPPPPQPQPQDQPPPEPEQQILDRIRKESENHQKEALKGRVQERPGDRDW